MNKIALVLAFSISLAFSDTLYMKNGEEIKDAAVTEIDDDNVKYKIGQRQVVYVAKKADIATILYDDGSKDVFSSEAEKINIPVEKETEKAEPKDSNNTETYWVTRYGFNVAYGIAVMPRNAREFDGCEPAPSLAIGAIIRHEMKDGTCIDIGLNMIYRNFAFHKEESYGDVLSFVNNQWQYINTFFPEEKGEISEYAIGASILFGFSLDFFYLGVGPFLDIPLSTKIKNNGEEWREYDSLRDWPKEKRDSPDIGPLLALGFNIGENFSFGGRAKAMGGGALGGGFGNHEIWQFEFMLGYLF